MNNKISPPHSLSKRNFKQIRINQVPKKNSNTSLKKPFINDIQEICNSIYEEFFPYILKLSKIQFFEKYNKEADEIFLFGKYKNFDNVRIILESKDNIIKRYDNDFEYLSEEYQNFLKNPNDYTFLKHFRKHCIDTDYYALHYCSANKMGKFIEIKNISKTKEIPYVICEGCQMCYLSKFILMLCSHCNKKYYSNILKENEDENIVPATWEKYHCNSLINEIMKCIKCKSILYYNLVSKKLVCLNKRCNFNSKPESILWKCNICTKEFRSSAKIYNPLEFQILNKSIDFALLKQIKAAPKELPCQCTKNISKLIFYHKDECKGELYNGILIDRAILVCNKCHAINFEEKFTWICPICSIRFHLHRVIGCKPFSKKKYIINKSYNQSERNAQKKKIDKAYLEKNLLNLSIPLYNQKNNNYQRTVNNSQKSNHFKFLPSEDMNNITTYNNNNNDNPKNKEKLYKKIDVNKNKNNKNDNYISNMVYDYKKQCWVINLKKGGRNKTKEEDNNKKYHTTLNDILQKRMLSESGKENKIENNNKFNQTMLPKKRINTNNNIKRKKNIHINEAIDNNKKYILNNAYSISNIIDKKKNQNNSNNLTKSVNLIEKEDKKNKRIFYSKIFNNNNTIDFNNEKRNFVTKLQKKKSPFKSEICLINHKRTDDKNNNVDKDDKANEKSKEIYEINNTSTISKNLNTINDSKRNKSSFINNLYTSLDSNNNNNDNDKINTNRESINSLGYWKKRGTPKKVEPINNKYRILNINNSLSNNKKDTELSFNELRDTSKNNINLSNNSSFRFSFIGNNSIIKANNRISSYNSQEKNNKNEKENEKCNYSEKRYRKFNTSYELENNFNSSGEKKKMLKHNNTEKNEIRKNDRFNINELYQNKDSNNSEEDDENKDTIKDLYNNKSSSKKNFREFLMLKGNLSRHNILISQEKLNDLVNKTNIPSINESEYSYLKPIGEGTYGIVYLVEHNKTGEQYALKKIICRDYNELIKQKNELELSFSVKHQNILKLYGIQFKYLDETTSAIYVLMELAQNDWSKEIKRRILAKKYYKESEIINLLKNIIKGFLFLQDKNIAHRDIKPQNILLFPNNVYKIADFGEAKFIRNSGEQSTLKGSELYMSPLLYKGYKYNQKNVLHNPFKSDVFSLGYCLLYAMCLNLKILEVVRELTTIKSIISNINKFMVKNKYSDQLINIIYKMIEPNEDLRYDFEDISMDLEKL